MSLIFYFHFKAEKQSHRWYQSQDSNSSTIIYSTLSFLICIKEYTFMLDLHVSLMCLTYHVF